MAEARSEEDEENMRDPRDQVVRRHPGGRPDRQKPEHRHSQGPLSSIRAAIKRTSRPAPVSDSSRERNRRRPEITILSAEPLASTSWFPGASGGFPPPPPPPAQIWGPSIPPASIQLPPSYEEVIREKTQEVLLPPSFSPCSSTSSRPASTTTIATQTDAGSTPNPRDSQERRPVRPRRPRLHLPSHAVDITTNSSPFTSLHSDSPLTLTSAAQTDHQDHFDTAASSHGLLERPRPRPRSRLNVQPVSSEVKVQTLVRLHDDCLATLASSPHQDVIQGKYLQELLEAFRTDDWGFPDCRGDSSGHSQSESEEGDQEEDMATLRARMQAFEKQVADESCGDTKRPEPRPRPRLQGQPAKSAPPTIAPKPKNILPGYKPSTALFWEENNSTTETLQPATESAPVPVPKPCEDTMTQSGLPLPAPRPPPLNVSSVSKTKLAKPPARPPVAPRTSAGVPPQDSSTATGHEIPTLPPRRSVEISRAETQDTAKQSVKTRKRRPDVPAKPLALNTPRRASAPDLLHKPPEATPSSPDQNPVPPTPSGLAHSLKSLASAPAPAYRRGPLIQTISETGSSADSTDPPQPPRPSSVKLLPPRSPSVKSIPGRPPPPSINTSANQTTPPPSRTSLAPAVLSASQAPPSPQSPASTVSAIQVQSQKASKKGPPLPPRPKPGHPLYNSYMVQRQEILIILDEQSPSEDQSGEGISQTLVTQPINQSQCLLDLDIQSEPAQHEDSKSKMASENLSKSESPSILPISPSDHKDLSEAPPISGPRCIALSDYEGEEDNELTFSQGDVITLLELTGPEWGRGQIYGRMGIFPLKFTEVVEPLPQSPEPLPQPGPSPNTTGSTGSKMSQDSESEAAEWVVALFDFPGQTEEDLSFRKGALIQVTEHIDAEWRRGRLEGREGLYPTAFTQGCQGEPIPGRLSAVRGVAKFDFTAESEDELTLKVGDIITQVETVDEQWILGVVGGKHGIAPKNFISLF